MVPIYGLLKTTLLDYNGHLASTIFLGHCNLRCPFCQNSTLLGPDIAESLIKEEEVFSHLKKRKHILEGVCITGGEPTLYKGLPEFIKSIKSLGYLVKLDTNGTNPKMLQSLIEKKQIDYIAMDIKNSKQHYKQTAGISEIDLGAIEESVSLLKNNPIPYEFRTTVVKEYHSLEDIRQIGEWLSGPSLYYIQNFKDSEHVLKKELHPFTKEELQEIKSILLPFLPKAQIRGDL